MFTLVEKEDFGIGIITHTYKNGPWTLEINKDISGGSDATLIREDAMMDLIRLRITKPKNDDIGITIENGIDVILSGTKDGLQNIAKCANDLAAMIDEVEKLMP